jgi:hypothetical protein
MHDTTRRDASRLYLVRRRVEVVKSVALHFIRLTKIPLEQEPIGKRERINRKDHKFEVSFCGPHAHVLCRNRKKVFCSPSAAASYLD